jgi:triosephosphate isomerase
MNGSEAMVAELLGGLLEASNSESFVDMAVFPPFPYLGQVKSLLEGSDIVGHSERRSLYSESDEDVAARFEAAIAIGLEPVLCVGETLQERENGATEAVVERQLDAVLQASGVEALARAVIAYEPVWAIGTGKTATPDQAQAVHAFIRNKIMLLDDTIGDHIRILYGGSVNGSNAADLFAREDIDGGLVGGASLKLEDFLAIRDAAA